MNWDYMMNGWMGGWMWMPMVLLLALLLALLALGVVAVSRATRGAPDGVEAPLTIAARRLARGEITKDQYEDLRSTLAE